MKSEINNCIIAAYSTIGIVSDMGLDGNINQ